jgi:uncharacterized membrane protein YjgN (DUF898 family)
MITRIAASDLLAHRTIAVQDCLLDAEFTGSTTFTFNRIINTFTIGAHCTVFTLGIYTGRTDMGWRRYYNNARRCRGRDTVAGVPSGGSMLHATRMLILYIQMESGVERRHHWLDIIHGQGFTICIRTHMARRKDSYSRFLPW